MRILTLVLLVLWILFWMIQLSAAYFLKKPRLRGWITRTGARGIMRLCHIHVRQVGELSNDRPLLIASNHLSYLDVPILASVMDTRFVPKKEVASWPVIGQVATMMDVVYVDRSKNKIHEGNDAMREALSDGNVVTLFPEATTGDGVHLLPFKPAFFQSVQGAMVQPVAVAYRKVNGLPIDIGQWPLIAWYGDMMLLPHLWNFLSLGQVEVEVHFLPAISSIGKDRKQLAIETNQSISDVLKQN